MAEPRRTIQVIMGPRQVGKSTMISQFVELTSIPCSLFSADSVEKQIQNGYRRNGTKPESE